MRQLLVKLTVVLSFAGLVGVPTLSAGAASTPVAGGACGVVGAKSVVGSPSVNQILTYTCVTAGKKKVWSAPKTTYQITTAINLTQAWTGNSVALSLVDSKGHACLQYQGSEPAGSECSGFYIGWQANWTDANRQITNGTVTTISGLQPGDKGNFYIAYQASANAPVILVKFFPFSYDSWS